MYKECPVCGQDYTIEPGYYTAAMWISYPILMILLVPAMLIVALNGGSYRSNMLAITLAIGLALILQIPLIRYSRAILINIDIAYRGF